MNADILNLFILAIQDVLSKQLNISFTKEKLGLNPTTSDGELLDIFLNISGELEGIIALRLPKALVARISTKIATNEPHRLGLKDFRVTLIKITCRISEIFKKKYTQGDVIMGQPQTLASYQHLPYPSDMPVISISFKTDCGVFYLESSYLNHSVNQTQIKG